MFCVSAGHQLEDPEPRPRLREVHGRSAGTGPCIATADSYCAPPMRTCIRLRWLLANPLAASFSMGPSCRRHVAAGLCGVIGEPYKAGGVWPATAKPAPQNFMRSLSSTRRFLRPVADARPRRTRRVPTAPASTSTNLVSAWGHFSWTSEFSESCQGLPELAAGAGPQLSREGAATSQSILFCVFGTASPYQHVPIRGALGFRGSGMRLPTSAEAEGPEASQLEPEEAENNGPRKARRVDATDAAVKRHAFVTIMGISPSKGARRAHHSAARDQSCGSRVPV